MISISRTLTTFVLALFLILSYSRLIDPASPEASQTVSSTISLNEAGTQCSQTLSDLVSWWPGDGNATDVIDGNDGLVNGVSESSINPRKYHEASSCSHLKNRVLKGSTK
jgi:hypothetical protein